jgi:hypothetical protein
MNKKELLNEISKLLIRFGDDNNDEMNYVTCELTFKDGYTSYFNGEKFLVTTK